MSSLPLKVLVPYQKGDRTYYIRIPDHRAVIKRSVCKNYLSMANAAVHSSDMRPPIVSKICTYIESEMTAMGSIGCDSIFKDSIEALKNFSWEAVHADTGLLMPLWMMKRMMRNQYKDPIKILRWLRCARSTESQK